VARVLLVSSAVALGVAAFFGVRPVTNPGVQQCGSPAVFAIRNGVDLQIPSPGSPEEPANAAVLRAQPRCHERVDSQLGHLGVALGLTIGLGLLGAALGLFDDRLSYRRAPRFESYLRERPADVPDDPWDQPVVPVDDLGERLPDIEWSEVRVVTGMSLLALVALPLLAPWSVVRAALADVSPAALVLVVLLVVLSYPLAAAGVVAATGDESDDASGFRATVETGVAASFTGRLLPAYGAAGLTVHQLVRAGAARRVAVRRVRSLEAVAIASHALLLVVIGLAVLVVGHPAGEPLRFGWLVSVFVLAMLAIGVVTGPRRYRNLVVRPGRRSPGDLRDLLARPVQLMAMAGACLGLALLDAALLLAAVHAFGGSAPGASVLFVSLLAAVAAVVAVTPDGAGVVEAVLVLGLIWAGVDAGPAVAAALLARVVRFWLPILPGWFALRRQQRAGIL
jgi:uncharacterized membrane protein YbhN (UPF0104 family)